LPLVVSEGSCHSHCDSHCCQSSSDQAAGKPEKQTALGDLLWAAPQELEHWEGVVLQDVHALVIRSKVVDVFFETLVPKLFADELDDLKMLLEPWPPLGVAFKQRLPNTECMASSFSYAVSGSFSSMSVISIMKHSNSASCPAMLEEVPPRHCTERSWGCGDLCPRRRLPRFLARGASPKQTGCV